MFKQRSKVNGFPYVINIQTDDRLYHLCSTQKEVHEEWLEKLREYHIPNTEVNIYFYCSGGVISVVFDIAVHPLQPIH